MIFINNAKKKIGKDGLIINLKANNFYEGQGLRTDDFHKLYEVYTKYNSKISLPPSTKQNFFLCILYYESTYNNEAKKILEQSDMNYLINDDWSDEEKLLLLFNIIEIEIKIRKKNINQLIVLYNELYKIKTDKEKLDYYLIQKHYFAYLKFLIDDYDTTDKFTDDIIFDMNDNKNTSDNKLINYLRIRNEILKIKMLELKDPDKNYKEIISHLDGLFEKAKNIKEDFAICVGIKILAMQSKEMLDFEENIKLIQEMLNVLKRETLYGKSHKNILEQYLYLTGLLGYYYSIKSDNEGVLKASKKMDKYLLDINEIKNSKEGNLGYDNLYLQYSYFNTMLKSSINNNSSEIKQIRKKITTKSEIDLLNMCIMEKDDLSMSKHFGQLEELFDGWKGQNKEIEKDKIILIYFYLYNKISNLTAKIVEEIGIRVHPNNQKIEEIRNLVTKLIEKTSKQIIDYKDENLKKVFKFPFFKNLFNKLYYVKIYSYYLEGKYKDCLNEYYKYNNIVKIQFELETPKSNEYMKKIEGDCYFRLEDYKKAEEIYNKIIAIGSNDPLIFFNMGLSAHLNNNLNAIGYLEKALSIYKEGNNFKKVVKLEELINKLKQGK